MNEKQETGTGSLSPLTHLVTPEETGRTLRDLLRNAMGVSYTALKSAKWGGRILVNGEASHTDRRVVAGDRVSVAPDTDQPLYIPKPYDIPLKVAWMDEHLMVVDKPGGLASQSSLNHPDDSLENAVYSFLGCPEGFVYRPVNRLDKGTGGLMVIARSGHAQHLAQKMLHTNQFRRRYLAWTDGIPPEPAGVLDAPIGKAPGATIRREVTPEGKPSRTRYRVLRASEGRALVLLELETGRTHQIRVHLSHIGCPVHGDFLYGTEDPAAFPGCFALHSAALELIHPLTGKYIRLTSRPSWVGEMDDSVFFVDF